jgi:Ca2+-binding EF-hand superfamily protein
MKEFLLGAAAIVIAGAAVAQTAAPQPAPATPQGVAVPHAAPMARFDREQTRDEAVAKVREHFAKLDANRDGFLTKAEAEAGHAAMRAARTERRGDRANRVERRDPAVAFDRLDGNKDGAISRDEFAKGREMRIERRVELKDGQAAAAGAEGHRMQFRRMGGAMMGGHMFEMADANKDSRVSLQEATDAAVRHFDMADANRDGRITPEERRTIRRQLIEKRRAPKAG